jgi:hypothetical protein
MSDDDNQGKIIQEQNQAERRIIRSVDDRTAPFRGKRQLTSGFIEQVRPTNVFSKCNPHPKKPQTIPKTRVPTWMTTLM